MNKPSISDFSVSWIVYLRVKKKQSLRENMVIREKNLIAETIVDRDKIILPPLNIILSFIKQSLKALNKKEG